jgi:AbrB family looped-hinge helix DNA binding protein
MVKLKVTSKGQVTLKKEVLNHLGIKPGDEMEIDLLPHSKAAIHAVERKFPIESLFGMLKNEEGLHFTIDEINEAIAAGWADEVKF